MNRKVARKKKPARAKPGRAKPVPSKPARKRAPAAPRARPPRAVATQRDFVESLMTAGAQALGLTIDPAWHKGVKFNLRLVLDHAARVEAFSLPDDAEPAPVFHA